LLREPKRGTGSTGPRFLHWKTLDTIPAPASSAEVAQPSQEVVETSTAPEGTGASEQVAEQTEEQRRASEAGRTLAEQRKKNAQAAQFRREFEQLKQERAELTRALIQATQQGKAPEPKASADEAPTREQFDSYEAYVREDAKYWARKEAERTFNERMQGLAQETQQQQARQEAAQVEQQHMSRVAEHAQKSSDFDALLAERGDHISVPPAAAHAIKYMDDGPQIMEAMLRQPELAKVFWNMPDHAQLMALGKISAHLQARPPQVSKAPPPGKTVGASSSGDGLSDDDSAESWIRKRNAQLAKRG
jgi:hypothetical protein